MVLLVSELAAQAAAAAAAAAGHWVCHWVCTAVETRLWLSTTYLLYIGQVQPLECSSPQSLVLTFAPAMVLQMSCLPSRVLPLANEYIQMWEHILLVLLTYLHESSSRSISIETYKCFRKRRVSHLQEDQNFGLSSFFSTLLKLKYSFTFLLMNTVSSARL